MERRKPQDWLAIDDDAEDWPAWCLDKFVRSDPEYGLSGPIWRIESVEDRPSVTLDSWSVYDVPLHGADSPCTWHFIGYSREDRQGQVSSPVEAFDPASGCGVTRSGRIYRLAGRPGGDADAVYVWQRWKGLNEVSEEHEVTMDVHAEMLAAQVTAGRVK